MARKRRRNRKSKQKKQAILNFVLAGLAIVLISFAMFAIRPAPYDERTLCGLTDEMPPHTAIIIDKTDEYSAAQADFIADAIRRTRGRLEVGERLSLFELDAQGQFDPRGEFSLCNPGRGDQVNSLFRNPKMIEERYAALFEAPMETVLADLVVPKEAPASPIVEAVARLAQTENFSDRAPRRSIVLISDMLQNSDLFTAYGGRGAMPSNVALAEDVADRITGRFGRSLDGVSLEIRLIPRDNFVDLQRGALKDYWNDLFADLGITVTWRDL